MTQASDNNPNIPDSGDFGEVPFPQVLWSLHRDARSGQLDIRDKPHAEGGKLMKRVVVGDGSAFAVLGGSVAETLADILLSRKKITAERYEQLKNENKGDYSKIEQQILSGAVIAPGEIPGLLTHQVTIKIKNLFPLIRGYYEFKDQSAAVLSQKHVLMPLDVVRLIAEAVPEHYPPARIKKEFAGIDKKLFHWGGGAKDRLPSFGWDAATQRWLRGLPDEFNLAAFFKGAPVREDKGLPMFLALYFTGVFVLNPADDKFALGDAYIDPNEAKAKAKAEAEKKAAAAKEAAKTEKASEAKTAAKAAEETKLPVEVMLESELSDADLFKEIDRMLGIAAKMRKKETTVFDLLGIEENTPDTKVKKIYFKFAKKFHPDSRPEFFKGDVRERVEDLFAKITEAYNLVSDPAQRAEYIKKLKSEVSDEAVEEAQRAVEAEMEFQKAEVLMKRGSWPAAAEKIERAISLYPDEPEYKMYMGWVHYKIKGPGETANAKRIIKEVLDKRPNAADGWYFLGMIEKNDGNMDAAEKDLEKYLAQKPHDIDAKRELQLLARKKSAPAAKKKGGFFGRK